MAVKRGSLQRGHGSERTRGVISAGLQTGDGLIRAGVERGVAVVTGFPWAQSSLGAEAAVGTWTTRSD